MAENNKFDYSQLDEEQLEALRAQLRGFSTGIKGSMRSAQADQPVLDAGGNHHSHSNTDGWV